MCKAVNKRKNQVGKEVLFILWLGKILGLLPYDGGLRLCPLLVIHSVGMVLLVCVATYLLYMKYVPKIWFHSVVDMVQMCVMVATWLSGAVVGVMKRESFVGWLRCVEEAEAVGGKVEGRTDGKKECGAWATCLAAAFCLHCWLFSLQGWYLLSWLGLLYGVAGLVVAVLVLWAVAVHRISARLPCSPCLPLSSTLPLRHSLLSSSLFHLDDFFSIQLLLALGSVFINSTVTLYLFLTWSLTPHSDHIPPGLITNSIWISFCIVQFLFIANTASDLKERCEDFHNSIYASMMTNPGECSDDDKEKFKLHLIAKEDMELNAGGFCPLDYSVIMAIAGATSMYLVIIVQYDLDCNCREPDTMTVD